MQKKLSEQTLANAIRALSIDAVQQANSGHPGMPLGMADVATVLFRDFLKYDPQDPSWPDRDRFVLSAGHGSMLLYSLLYLTGYEGITLEDLKSFRQLHAKTAGHPEFSYLPGIETTTGPLGQGLANAVGMALSERLLQDRLGKDLIDHKTYALVGDGCLMEGISQEAISLAGHLKLKNLIALWDDNGITIDGSVDLSSSEDQLARFQASGWKTLEADGHDFDAITKALNEAQNSTQPVLIAFKTVIGYGSPHKAGTSKAHGSPLGEEELALTKESLGWTAGPFEIPQDILTEWRTAQKKGAKAHQAWKDRFAQTSDGTKALFKTHFESDLKETLAAPFEALKKQILADKPTLASRASSAKVLEALIPHAPQLLGGSADLTGSNLTRTADHKAVTPDDFSGNYLYYGIREHGMAAMMNGISLHGGFRPYGGTFFVFTDYCRPSIRLSSLMKQPVVYVMTHDSIGLGEDGPTHQPVEHLASLRAMPNLNVFRPCDAIETAEAWQLSLETTQTPSILALSRQGLPTLRTDVAENKTALGAYVLKEASGPRDLTLIATGSEVILASETCSELEKKGLKVAVVSMPCWELFAQQPKDYQQKVLGSALRVSIEAGSPFGWSQWVGENGLSFGVEGFGLSGPYKEVYKHFGLDVEQISANILTHLKK